MTGKSKTVLKTRFLSVTSQHTKIKTTAYPPLMILVIAFLRKPRTVNTKKSVLLHCTMQIYIAGRS
jgi:hypothetical protein